MSDFFKQHIIYPYGGGSIKNYFEDGFDTVFISLLPFFQFQESFINTISESEYPDESIIYKNAAVLTWSEIVTGSGMDDFSEINKALRTSIGALRKVFQRPDLAKKLVEYTNGKHIWQPTEGRYDVFSKTRIYRILKLLHKTEVVIADEFFDNVRTLDIAKITEHEFCAAIGWDLYIYPSDKDLLFTMHWDSFFFLIVANKQTIDKIQMQNLFEGFLVDDNTTNDWDYETGELEALLKMEEDLKNSKH